MSSQVINPIKSIIQNTTFLAVFAIFLLSCLIYSQTWEGLVAIWIRSETFAHGFIVIPISLWVIWQKKQLHPYLRPTQPSLIGLIFVLLNGFLWFLASLIHALVIQQYALIGILIGSIWFYLGNETCKKLIFPLAFLYFMVPVGEALLPYLMQYTADFTIYLLRKTGLSVYREGMNFTLISGQWSVVEACSGLRYLLASFTLGTIYAYITYSKTYKRVIFTLLSIILPIIANGFRAYMIVMLGHLSGMTLAVGVDHLIYGAIFFALIIFVMFYVGSFWKDPAPEINIKPQTISSKTPPYYSTKQNSQIAIILLISLSLWPISSYWLQSHYHAQTQIPEWPPLTQNSDWREIKMPSWGWRPKFDGAVNESLRYFQKDSNKVGFYQANFGDEEQGKELINNSNQLIQLKDRKYWHFIKKTILRYNSTNILLPKKTNFAVLRSTTNDILTLSWYQIGHDTTENQYIAKLYQLYKRLTNDNSPELQYVIFMSTESHNYYKKIQYLIEIIERPLFDNS